MMYNITIEHTYVLPTDPANRSKFTSVRNCPIVTILVSRYDAVTFKGHVPNIYNIFIDQGPPHYIHLDLICKNYKLDDNDIIVKANGDPIDNNTSEPVILDWWTESTIELITINKQPIDAIAARHTVNISIPGNSNRADVKAMIELCVEFIKAHQLSNTTNTGFTRIESETEYDYPVQIQGIINLLAKYITKTNWKDSAIMQYKFLNAASAKRSNVDPMERRKQLITKLFKKL